MRAPAANYWLDDDCARAVWDQHHAVPYQELLRDTGRLLDAKPGERWLDLGCGSGQLTALIWRKSRGRVGQIIAFDCAAANALAVGRIRDRLTPRPGPKQIAFVLGNFSHGLGQFPAASFDGVTSGLALSYAESWDPLTRRYTDAAYNRAFDEVYRVVKPGGQFVFSVNVPQPRFWCIFWKSLRVAFRLSKPAKVLINSVRMQGYGRWLQREAARGRFHFLPLPVIVERLEQTGFRVVKAALSYAGQAYLLSALKRATQPPHPGHLALVYSAWYETDQPVVDGSHLPL
jgi:ubiquinone/menaquinone biosynthesis C-methylase UbiE